LEKEYFAKCPDKTPQALAAKVENAIKNKFRRKCDSAVARLVSRTLRERQRIGRLISAVEVDEHRCRMVFMECDIAKRHGSVQGYSHKKALAVAQDRVRKITAMPIKMRLTLEKMELKLLRRRIAATHDLA